MTQPYPFDLREPDLPTFGLIVLRADETIEQEFRRHFPPDAARLHVTRVHSGDTLSPGSIAAMEARLSASAALLPPAASFDAVGYACTSGTALIGAARVHAMIAEGVTAPAFTDPLTAAIARMRDLKLRRIGILSPYVPSVAAPLCSAFAAAGFDVPETLSFGEEIEARVARIDPRSIARAARALAGRGPLDGLFLSCTNLQTIDITADLERELGLPVVASNQAMAWHMTQLAVSGRKPAG